MPTWSVTGLIAAMAAVGLRIGADVSLASALWGGVALAGTIHALVVATLRFARIPTTVGRRDLLDPLGSVLAARRRSEITADRASYERVRGNVRLMGLAELWSAVSEDDPDGALLQRVAGFCQRETGHAEIGLFRLDARAGEIVGQWIEPRPHGARTQRFRWALGGLEGGLMRALRTEVPFDARPGTGVALLTVNGEKPRLLGLDDGYTVFPLVAPAPISACADATGRGRTHCEDFQPHPVTGRPEGIAATSVQPRGLCASCRRYPVHGALVVTDRSRNRPVSPGETGLLESVAATVASVQEHAALFRDVKSAERFREQVLDAMMNGLVSTDSHGRIVFSNRQARSLLGRGDVQGQNLDTLLELPEGSSAITPTLPASGLVRAIASRSCARSR